MFCTLSIESTVIEKHGQRSAHVVFIVYNTPCLYGSFYEVEIKNEGIFHFGFCIHRLVHLGNASTIGIWFIVPYLNTS